MGIFYIENDTFGGLYEQSQDFQEICGLADQLVGGQGCNPSRVACFCENLRRISKIESRAVGAEELPLHGMTVIFAQDGGGYVDQGNCLGMRYAMVMLPHLPVIGMGILFDLPLLTGRVGRIESVVVDNAYRGRGIGKEITLRLIAKAKELGLGTIDLTSNPAREAANALYQKLGFERYDTNVYRLRLK